MSVTKMVPMVHVSLSDALEDSMSQRAVRIREEDLPSGISLVQVPGVGKIPTVVALRTMLEAVYDPGLSGVTAVYQWKVVISPYEQNLLIRLFGRQSGRIDDEVSIRYELPPKIRQVHEIITMMQPPVGTTLQLTFAFTKSGAPELEWFASSVEREKRLCKAAINRNKLRIARAFPFGWLVKLTKRGLVDVPFVPDSDCWLEEHKVDLDRTVRDQFVPILGSLWKAVFVQEGIQQALRSDGYEIDRIGRTIIGSQGLATIIRLQRDRLTHLTHLHIPQED